MPKTIAAHVWTASLVLLVLTVTCVLAAASARGETYVAPFLGMTFPQSLSDVNQIGPNRTRISDIDLKNSVVYGGKIGHYFEHPSWLGIETELFRTTPHISQQPVTVTTVGVGSTTSIQPGASLTMTTWAANLVARYPGRRFQPYVGIGPGLFFAQVRSDATTSMFGEAQATNIGLNTQVGVRYLITWRLALFTEWKYNHVRLSFDSFPNASYNAHHVVFGLAYQF